MQASQFAIQEAKAGGENIRAMADHHIKLQQFVFPFAENDIIALHAKTCFSGFCHCLSVGNKEENVELVTRA
jgi:hypothetical protein